MASETKISDLKTELRTETVLQRRSAAVTPAQLPRPSPDDLAQRGPAPHVRCFYADPGQGRARARENRTQSPDLSAPPHPEG